MLECILYILNTFLLIAVCTANTCVHLFTKPKNFFVDGQLFSLLCSDFFCESTFVPEFEPCQVNVISEWLLLIQCNSDSCFEHIAGGADIYLYGCVSLLAPVCAVCLCLYECV